MLFGDDAQLYKSHVDGDYLGSGYIAHRAYAVVPLYDLATRKAFADGEYEIEFNYQLQYDGSWVSKAYNFTIDSSAPTIKSIKEYEDNGVKRVRIEIDELKVAYASLGIYVADVKYDTANKVYYIDETAETIEKMMDALGTLSNGQRRLTLSVTDAAYGTNSAIIHFFGSTYENYVLAQGTGLATNHDFVKNGDQIYWYEIGTGGFETEFTQTGYVTITTHVAKPGESLHDHVDANHDGHCDICGAEFEADDKDLNFFQRIAKFFRQLFQKIANLFKGKSSN